jgi:hypothetical protein
MKRNSLYPHNHSDGFYTHRERISIMNDIFIPKKNPFKFERIVLVRFLIGTVIIGQVIQFALKRT